MGVELALTDRGPAAAPRRRHDPSTVVFVAVGVLLGVLVLMPLAWLGYFALTTEAGAPTLANLATLLVDPALRDPLLTSLAIAVASALAACVVAAPVALLVADG